MSAWLASASLEAADVIDAKTALAAAMNAAIRDPLNGMWLVSVVGGFIFFTDTHVRSWRILGGAFHAVSHLAAAFVVGWLALLLTLNVFELGYGTIPQLLISGLITFVVGGPVGAFILGVYLFVSIRLFGRHGNEAFSSLRIAGFQALAAGCASTPAAWLTIHAIAHRSRAAPLACRATRNGEQTMEPDDARAARPSDSSTRLKCAESDAQRVTPIRYQATGMASRRMLNPSMVTR